MSPSPLPAGQAYRIWADGYDTENPVTTLDQEVAQALTPPLTGQRLLDAGCGSGRRIPMHGVDRPAIAVGIDLVREMLRARSRAAHVHFAVGDLRTLPIATASFAVLWCRLVIGHVRELHLAYREFARVVAPGGTVVVTDFHPDAIAAGHRRVFRDRAGTRHEIEHHTHTLEDHRAAATPHGLRFDRHLDRCVGPPQRPFYESAGKAEAYETHRDLPLVLGMRFTR